MFLYLALTGYKQQIRYYLSSRSEPWSLLLERVSIVLGPQKFQDYDEESDDQVEFFLADFPNLKLRIFLKIFHCQYVQKVCRIEFFLTINQVGQGFYLLLYFFIHVRFGLTVSYMLLTAQSQTGGRITNHFFLNYTKKQKKKNSLIGLINLLQAFICYISKVK